MWGESTWSEKTRGLLFSLMEVWTLLTLDLTYNCDWQLTTDNWRLTTDDWAKIAYPYSLKASRKGHCLSLCSRSVYQPARIWGLLTKPLMRPVWFTAPGTSFMSWSMMFTVSQFYDPACGYFCVSYCVCYSTYLFTICDPQFKLCNVISVDVKPRKGHMGSWEYFGKE